MSQRFSAAKSCSHQAAASVGFPLEESAALPASLVGEGGKGAFLGAEQRSCQHQAGAKAGMYIRA